MSKECECQACGMHVGSTAEYHPYAACLMFRACGNGNTVQANLDAVVEHGRKKGADLAATREAELVEQVQVLQKIVKEYREKTPLGHQPHMLASRADATLAQTEKLL